MNSRTWLYAALLPAAIGLVFMTVALIGGEGTTPTTAPGAASAPLQGPTYSPFVVQVQDEAPFSTISFKDVGIADVERDRSVELYELVAESLRHELQSHPDRQLTSHVLYDEAVADPANHTFCAGRHIYVDMWRVAGTGQWGYSLWSGCSEDDNFAWRQVDVEAGLSREEAVDAMASEIGRDLREAISTGCFTRAC